MNEQKPQKPVVPGAESGSTSSLRMILTMGGIGLFCGVLIVATFQLTFPTIKVNKRRALEKAIFEVVPGATEKTTFAVVDGRLRRLEGEDDAVVKYYACYGSERELVGVAIGAQGQGFQDILGILYGYSTLKEAVVGVKVLESKETPGLGDKIETDPNFLANFEALEVQLNDDGKTVTHPIELVKRGKKTDAWQVEAITGATISSRAIATILRKSTATSVPIIVDNMSVLEEVSDQ
jgi:electron transport complex protein RnfG